MKRLSAVSGICVVMLLAACSHPESVQTDRETVVFEKQFPDEDFYPDPLSLVSLGDSLTQGVGDSSGAGGYVPLLEQKLQERSEIGEVSIDNFGKRGNRSDQLLKRVKEEQEIRSSISESDIAVITIGGNDVMKVIRSTFPSMTYEDFEGARLIYEENLTQLFSEIRELNPDISIVLMGIYNPFYIFSADIEEMRLIVEAWNESAETIASDWENTSYVEVADLFRQNDNNLLHSDYFHPNDQGYSLIAERIEEGVLNVYENGADEGVETSEE
ncbi:SGNH/GDSL hydrolase family protein [Jeotgalibacillus sp. R-1-5s-1]|uniref:SGNH/GDSL hydrolase family protein n=1 Tax=Jeotgalibacillus sp. R-1-5s-1 TaxID=2555897 RepID=UPI00106DC8CA|nr:SGNH/GDSL hydrolase family protein [Jeotgalibacillus sp. R-1-5s-1]TFE03276.1 GDSL family lipase [Jeotgalibacillus sp. R-1-5s-1]